MIPNRRFILNNICVFVIIIFFGSCNEKKGTTVYKKPLNEKFDAVCTWLNDNNNFYKENYYSVFYEYYNRKIKEKKFKDAAQAMEFVSLISSGYASFDETFLKEVLSFSKNYKDKVPPINSTFVYTFQGDYYSDKGDFEKAIANYIKNTSIDIVDYKSCYKKGDAYRTISWCYNSLGKQKLALENNHKAHDCFKQTDRTNILEGIYANYAHIYMAMDDCDKAVENVDIAIKYAKLEKRNNLFTHLFNKINYYDHCKKFDKMYPLIDSTYQAFNKSGIKDTSIKVSLSVYYIHRLFAEDKLVESKKILDELKPEVEALNSSITNQEYAVVSAFYEVQKHDGIKDIKLIKNSIPHFLELRNFPKARDCYALLLEDALARKDYKEALDYRVDFEAVKDSIGNMEMTDKVMELSAKYETEKKEQQIEIQKKSILNKNTTIALLISFLIGLIFIVIAVTLKQKQKKLKLEKHNVQLYTKQLLEKTEEERKRIASDLHDSVSHELLSLKNSIEQKTDTTDKKIDAIINDIRSISRNLHPIMFDKVGLKASINQMVERAQSINDFMVTADVDYITVLPSSIELQIYRIIQEGLSNIIKYANAVAAKITVTENKNHIIIEIKDNGKGFDVNETLNNNNSFGLHNIIERSRAIGGEAKIVSGKKGTIITIEIKKN
ncbi:tetratricopeptide repeat-containing sensor histidine kinase [Flavobacterium cerinum]|uniref:histidine kinase n=1 Tax=Flavobacterium cerinum TaxID=2502784 RepID=A0A444HCI2_9FLAO|nr:sensor histidine kinase [Flavobacterium cerinum]RWX01383.1 sensor histidine kinase [Flavobacterium cerinum]